ncbi:putative polygalacturonate 4-alpha-galacturonosyltransferase [Helianthus annuus]|uniref:Hexosyltransferase n=1 Tax=Helianthus annuus TaxID=4232 RepID=A0A251RZG2_HELAN|nr:probable galacturonosyltransferase 4 [Helianthus annuus]KAF5760408.1 putative polygalacturonate 4-alpha-galacturonosyltransferase [Helianthus annuus]KAJ0438466.1 putative polygalacturonate 4-alpha-galacturonosyltransferase [Helianthus annuus]KAJ0443221.1 putative polygalacturonate 4-alpha-galacturonosyltransferase [Helianthus annuus]KAJ0460789.1 putative polygalacturonate 4-alpha-galacturonosyltransferase [Helianthus annuus]KAJ0645119.1 putative polygalacturonate 4-alpha-galacturonosyltrans
MKLKLSLRKPVLVLLFLTVLAPIVLYTDKLTTFSSYEFIQEPSTLSFNRDVRPLNLLPEELSETLKEPLGDVHVENLSRSVEHVDGESSRRIRQLNEESKGIETIVLSQEYNPIKQVTQGQNRVESVENKENLKVKVAELPQHSSSATKSETKPEAQKPGKREPAKPKSDKPNEHVIVDNRVRYLKDQLIRARVYLSLTATRTNAQFSRELRTRVKEVQRALGDATKDTDLPKGTYDKLKAMDQTLAKGKQIQDDCTAVVKKLRAIIHSTEEQARVHQKQALFLTHLTAKTVPKGLHCLPLRLSTEYYSLNSSSQQFPNQEKLDDPNLFHYALFSDNVLATAVVVNSTVTNAKDPSKHVFHIVTDKLNYAAMRMWFLSNPPGKATIQVQNIDEFTWLNASYSPVLKQLASRNMIDYYFKTHKGSESDSNLKFRNPKYLSMMNHLRFYLPEIFPKLRKVVFLDDDIVVQKDLSGLWSIDLKGKVNGAVETCGENFHRFDRYLNFSNPIIAKNFDPRACGWAYGMNVFDLEEWKKQNITDVYHSWQNLNHDRQLWKLGTLPPGLITFWKRVYALEKSWHVLGLGYNPSVSQKEIERAAVVHYNGNLKPWLEIGIPKFRGYWNKYVDYDQAYLRDCNLSP